MVAITYNLVMKNHEEWLISPIKLWNLPVGNLFQFAIENHRRKFRSQTSDNMDR